MLELLSSGGVAAFVTLTYRDDCLPESVSPRELSLWLKRLRWEVSPEKVRFYGVGEYGDVSGRPHYHVLLFGRIGELRVGLHKACDCVVCRTWGKGFVHVGEVTPQSIAYCVSYISKGMTSVEDVRLRGRHPEFCRMSLRPGIGAGSVDGLLDAVATKGGAIHVIERGDVPGRVRHGGQLWPLGRYLVRKLRAAYGMDAAAVDRANRNVALELQESLSVKGARDLHEQKRLQAARKARFLNSVSRTKKGIGL